MGPHEPTPTPTLEDLTCALKAYPPEIVAAAAEIVAAAAEAWHPLAEIVAAAAEAWHQLAKLERLATKWAEMAHPEWVKILNRTKKRRTYKKYMDRILRAYEEETA